MANKKIAVKLFIKYWGRDDKLEKIASEEHLIDCDEEKFLDWVIPSTETKDDGTIRHNTNFDWDTPQIIRVSQSNVRHINIRVFCIGGFNPI